MPYKDERWLKNRYHGDGLTIGEIADEEGVAVGTIQYYMDKYNVQSRRPGPKKKDGMFNNSSWLKEKYLEEGLSSREIADICETNKTIILDRMEEHGIDRREGDEYILEGKLNEREWLKKKYHDEGKSMREISNICGVSKWAIRKRLVDFNIDLKDKQDALRNKIEVNIDREWIKEMYNKGGTLEEISRSFGGEISPSTVRERLIESGVSLREPHQRRSEGNHNDPVWLEEKYSNGDSVLDIAEECGVTSSTIYSRFREFGIETTGEGGWAEKDVETKDGKFVCSWYEKEVYNFLCDIEVDFEYEPDLESKYKPDFMLSDGTLIEVWGMEGNYNYTQRRKEKEEWYRDNGYSLVGLFPEDIRQEKYNVITNIVENHG